MPVRSSRSRAKLKLLLTGCICSSRNQSAWLHDGTCGGCLRQSPQDRCKLVLGYSGAVQKRQVFAREFTPLLSVSSCICPQAGQLGLERRDTRCQIARGRAGFCRRFDFVEDVPVGRVERIATASGLARNRCRRDPNVAARMVGMPPIAARQPRQRRPVAACCGARSPIRFSPAHRHLLFAPERRHTAGLPR